MKNLQLLALLFFITSAHISFSQNTKQLRIARTEEATDLSNYFNPTLAPFYHGVSSGDPLQDRVIIWTRITPTEETTVNVKWKVSTSPSMSPIVMQGEVQTDLSKDYTVKVDVSNLSAATTYYYSFEALGQTSMIGRTRTAPEGDINQLRFAVVSCSNYQDGYFNVYEKLSERNDIDAVIHLGDYIYEYESGGYGYSDEIGRGHLPENEIVSLTDYRIRYSYYKLDPQLQKAHQQLPFITIWDDHEFANNAWMHGAENHQPDTEGDWEARKQNAYKAYFEWMPVRESSEENRIYRSINYGNLLDLILLDTRMAGREEQEGGIFGRKSNHEVTHELNSKKDYEQYLSRAIPLDIKRQLKTEEFNFLIDRLSTWASQDLSIEQMNALKTNSDFNKVKSIVDKALHNAAMTKAKTAKSPELLGNDQFEWLENELKKDSQWKVIANQVLLMPLNGIPLTDTWDGYPSERERLLSFIENNSIKNVVVLTGDIHFTLASDLPSSLLSYTFNKANSKAVEFVTPSITSANLDEFDGISESFLAWLVELFNPHIKNTDLKQHGYFILTVTKNQAQADWLYVNTIVTQNATEHNGASLAVHKNETNLFETSPVTTGNNLYGAPAPLAKVSPSSKNMLLVIGNYPNPASTYTNIHYVLESNSSVSISIKNSQGKEIQSYQFSNQPAGVYSSLINTATLFPGIYFYEVATGNQSFTRKLIIK